MSFYIASTNSAFVAQTIIRIILVILLIVNFFLQIPFLTDIELYVILYLGYLLIVPPILHFKKTPTITLNQKPSEIEIPIRKKFVTAQEELDKAVANAADHPEDAMGYIRTAISLSITRKFGFKKINSMKGFFIDAEEFDLPLPGYSIIYTIFNEGSKRLHEGKINTNFEVSQAINTVTNFIAELEQLVISKEQIDDFKIKCKSVF